MRISCEHHHAEPHISQGYLATERQSLGGGEGPGRERCRAGTLGPRGPVPYRTHQWVLHPRFIIGKLRLKEVTQRLE